MKDKNKFFYFGEKVSSYEVRVLNEREVRAGSGILFLGAVISFLNAFLVGNFYFLKIFIVCFFIDFVIRVLVNPKFSPSLILGRFFVQNQVPEYTGAPQKRFAWSLGLILSFIMLILVVLLDLRSPINLIICLICLTLLFLETSFGICLGCKIYNLTHKDQAKLCPGGVCEYHPKQEIQKIKGVQVLSLVGFVILMLSISIFIK